jgi:hypothetical protein
MKHELKESLELWKDREDFSHFHWMGSKIC